MQLTLQRTLLVALGVLLIAFGTVSFAHAEDDATVQVSAETTVQVDVRTATGTPPKFRPGAPFQNKQLKEFKENAKDAIKDVSAKARIEMRAASSSGEKKNIMENLREKKEDLKNDRKEKMQSFKERIQLLARTHIGASINRFTAAINHFENIAERIESRIDKLNDRGINTVNVEASLKTAVDLTATAKADVAALKTLLNSVTDTSDPATVKAQIRAAIEKATASIKAAHQALMKTARELSALVRASGGINSTTTVDVQ